MGRTSKYQRPDFEHELELAAFFKKNFTHPATFTIRNKFSFMISFICMTAGTILENSISMYIIAGEICFRYASGIKIMYDEHKNDDN